MSSAWNLVTEGILTKLFDPEVKIFLTRPGNAPILSWLDDSQSLIAHSRTYKGGPGGGYTSDYYDYSFMITPAFKALELWLIAIAPYLGVEEELIEKARNHGTFNTFLNDESIQKLVTTVAKKLELKAEKSREMRQSLEALGSYLKNLRHSPAHCGSTISNPEKANTYFYEIVGGIDRITKLLLEQKVISD